MVDDKLAFSLDLLAAARATAQPLDVCEDGHLVVRGNTHWRPLRFSTDLKALLCEVAVHGESS